MKIQKIKNIRNLFFDKSCINRQENNWRQTHFTKISTMSAKCEYNETEGTQKDSAANTDCRALD